jgi:hypothetical protein
MLKLPDVDQLGAHSVALLELVEHIAGGMSAHPALSAGPQDYRNAECSALGHTISLTGLLRV